MAVSNENLYFVKCRAFQWPDKGYQTLQLPKDSWTAKMERTREARLPPYGMVSTVVGNLATVTVVENPEWLTASVGPQATIPLPRSTRPCSSGGALLYF